MTAAIGSSPRHPVLPLVSDSQRPIIITIDGPAGTGKSTVATRLAHRLGLDVLDTGAMYRAATAALIDGGVSPDDEPAVLRAVEAADIAFDWGADPPRILASGRPVDRRIRDADVESLVSRVASIGAVRRHLVQKQRQIAQAHRRLVTEGRDQGTVVFPDAPVKFYLDAAPQVRARRRADQLRSAGRSVDEAALLREIIERDRSDSSRRDGPLVCPADAERIDTSGLELDQVVALLEQFVRRRVAAL